MRFCILAFLLLNEAQAATWKVNIIFPDDEKKIFVPDDGNWDLQMPKSKWKCVLKKEDVDGKEHPVMYSRDLHCSKGKDDLYLPVTCFTERGGSSVQLYENNGKTAHRIAVKCNDNR